MPSNVVLTGMMGSGKSSVAKALAARLGYDVVDVDEIVERNAGASIQQIFDARGEAAFRALESEAIAGMAAWSRFVIACGGGAILTIGNLRALQDAGPIVYLRATAGTLASRIDDTDRPLLKGDVKGNLERILAERGAAYRAAADLVIDTDDLTVDEVAQRIEQALAG